MQALCHWEVQGGEPSESLVDLAEAFAPGRDPVPYARVLCDAYLQWQSLVDEHIKRALTDWSLERLDAVDRNVLRIATAELLESETPHTVVLDEAIEIAKAFGSASSPKFVNGVLDAIYGNIGGV